MDEESKKNLVQFFTFYKFPLILASIGVLFLIVGIIYVVKTHNAASSVVFTEATSSGKIEKVKIHVDIEGAVLKPGVYQVEEGSMITSALSSAGGLSAGADRDWISKNMNLAAKLTDGGKIYIPSVNEATVGKATTNLSDLSNLSDTSNLLGVTTGKVNVNTANQAELEGLPGVGPVTAGKIILNRPYQLPDELKSKKAVGSALFEKIKDLIVVY